MSSMLQIANLGSSYAAGPAIPPSVGPIAAGRSGNNFAHLVANYFNGNLTDLTVSGATLDNVLTTPQVVDSMNTFPPQIDGLPPNQDIVFILGGGNDLGYIGGLTVESDAAVAAAAAAASSPPAAAAPAGGNGRRDGNGSSPSWLLWSQALIADQQGLFASLSPLSSMFRSRVATTPPTTTFDDVATKLGVVAERVHSTSPNAQIFLVEYLPLISGDTKPESAYLPLNQSRIDQYKGIYDGLTAAYVEASKSRPWLTLVNLNDGEPSAHALGSQDPWMWGYDTDEARFHPMLIGHQKVAGKLIQLIRPKMT